MASVSKIGYDPTLEGADKVPLTRDVLLPLELQSVV
ncbi:hypothetical protein KIPB_006276, partial [Kipferlia bialata]|eukprot:g6276.t1